jgi:hypothetical protein
MACLARLRSNLSANSEKPLTHQNQFLRRPVAMIPSMNTWRLSIATLVILGGLAGTLWDAFAQGQTQAALFQVPFVGCDSDGQVGPLKAPNAKAKKLALAAELADRLAYYRAQNGFGVLAPRGWYCFSTSGSSGSNLYISSEPIDRKALFSANWRGFSGAAIQVSVLAGDTSGRFEVAKTIARVFPDHKEFVQDVIAEGIEPASSFPAGPYPADKITHRSENLVEFETPPNTKGLGTDSMLRANSIPIQGVAILSGDELSLVQASVRLSPTDQVLIRTILKQIEKEAAESDSHSCEVPATPLAKPATASAPISAHSPPTP